MLHIRHIHLPVEAARHTHTVALMRDHYSLFLLQAVVSPERVAACYCNLHCHILARSQVLHRGRKHTGLEVGYCTGHRIVAEAVFHHQARHSVRAEAHGTGSVGSEDSCSHSAGHSRAGFVEVALDYMVQTRAHRMGCLRHTDFVRTHYIGLLLHVLPAQ